MHVCMSVDMSIHSHISITTCPNFTNFSVPAKCSRGLVPALTAMQYRPTSSFVDDVTFAHNRRQKGSHAVTMSTPSINNNIQSARQRRRQWGVYSVTHQAAATGAKSDIYDCLVQTWRRLRIKDELTCAKGSERGNLTGVRLQR